MPKASNHLALTRQWELLSLLPRRAPGITAKELASRLKERGYEVTKRTIERDLTQLSTVFGLACNDKSIPYGWYWMPGTSTDLLGVSIADAISLNLIEEFLRPLVPAAMLGTLESRFQQARNKLDELSEGNKAARWVHKVKYVAPTLSLLPPKIDEAVLEAVQEALLTEKQLRIRYRRPKKSVLNDYVIHPLGIAQRGSVTYLAATAFNYTEVRLYAVHRIEHAVLLEDVVSTPVDFTIASYVESGALHFGACREIRLKARINRGLATILTETPLATDQRIAPAEGEACILEATCIDTQQLRWWILGQNDAIEIMAPIELRRDIHSALSKALKLYATDDGTKELPPAV